MISRYRLLQSVCLTTRIPKRTAATAAAGQKWSITLNTGAKIPAFGLGTWLSKKGEVGAAVEAALKAGYRHIDSAHTYRNDAEIGEALQECFKEGVVKREELFVTSKLINAGHAEEDVLPSLQTILKNLKLDYLDLFLVHWPLALTREADTLALTDDQRLGYDEEREAKCWSAMEELYNNGFVKAIGLSNFSITKTENLLKTAKIVPAVNQVECHPYLQQPKLKQYCDSKGIIVEAYSPLGTPGNPLSEGAPRVIDDPVITDIAEKHNTSVAQVCISFALHRGMVVIPKTVNPVRVTENLKSTELKLDAEDMRRLRELDRSLRYVKGYVWVREEWGDIDEYLWDTTEDAKFEMSPPG